MSNIHGIGSSKAPRQPKPAKSDSPFKGTARTLDGKKIEYKDDPIPASPLPTNGITEENAISDMPKELTSSFWSWNLPQSEDIGCCTMAGLSFCPCFVGDLNSEVRKSDWKRLFTMFSFWLSIVQIVLYIVTCALTSSPGILLKPSVSVLISFGANSKLLLKNSYEYYRLILYMLLHGSLFHILFNMFAQLTFCLGLETGFGNLRYISSYIVSGIVGGLFSTLRKSLDCGVGASAALFGIFGVYIAFIIIYWARLNAMLKGVITTWLIMFPILFLAVSFLPNVDILGHVGGFLAGLFLGCMFYAKRADSSTKVKMFFTLGLFGLLATALIPLLLLLLA